MIDKISKSYVPFQEIFRTTFRRVNQKAIEIMLMLACGHIFEIFTPNQLAQTLGIDKNKVYGAIKYWSIFLFRRFFFVVGCHLALTLIKGCLSKSPATLSGMRITLNVDDTVIDRPGKLISLTYNWYSGRHKKITKGQNIIVITIKIGRKIIPLNIRPVGKQGRSNTSKPEVFREMLREVLAFFRQEGIDLTMFPITFDSWYGSEELVKMLKSEGFDTILIHTKGNYVFTIDGKKKELSAHKKDIQLRDNEWGCKGIPVARKEAESPTFGKVVLLFFREAGKVKCVMVFGRKLRACEIMSIWKQHHSVECFWRRLKTDLQIHKVRMRDREGVYAMVAIKLPAYLLMEHLSAMTGLTFHQIKIHAKREVNIVSFFNEHFHSFMAA